MLMICFVCYIVLPFGATRTLNVIHKKVMFSLFVAPGAQRNRFDAGGQHFIFPRVMLQYCFLPIISDTEM